MLFSLTMFPVGHGSAVGRPVSEAIDEIDRARLPYHVTAMQTVLEGEWNEVMPVIHAAEVRMRAQYGRVFMSLTIDDRPGAIHRLHGAVDDVEQYLGRHLEQNGAPR